MCRSATKRSLNGNGISATEQQSRPTARRPSHPAAADNVHSRGVPVRTPQVVFVGVLPGLRVLWGRRYRLPARAWPRGRRGSAGKAGSGKMLAAERLARILRVALRVEGRL